MKTPVALVLLALVALWSSANGQDVGQVYCGRRLATALGFLCDNMLIKRSPPEHNAVDVAWPWLAPHSARGLGRGKRQDGIVSECCMKPCTVDELMTYCGY